MQLSTRARFAQNVRSTRWRSQPPNDLAEAVSDLSPPHYAERILLLIAGLVFITIDRRTRPLLIVLHHDRRDSLARRPRWNTVHRGDRAGDFPPALVPQPAAAWRRSGYAHLNRACDRGSPAEWPAEPARAC